MDKDALIRRLMKTFLSELEEHVRALDRDLLLLERKTDAQNREEVFRNLFRTGHSLKGAARAVNLDVLESTGHQLESLFAAARDGVVNLDASLFDLLFRTVDAIRDAGRRLGAGEDISPGSLTVLLPQLKDACNNIAPSSHQPETSSSSTIEDDAYQPPSGEAPPVPASLETQPKDTFIRISSARLDRLIAFSGELRVARSRTVVRDADIDRLLNMSKQWQVDWLAAERSLRRSPHQDHNAKRSTLENGHGSNPAEQLFELGKQNLRNLIQQLSQLAGSLIADRRGLDQVAVTLEDEVVRARMMPFTDACVGLERAARDLAKESGKLVRLTIDGGDIEIDRSVVTRIKNALLHLVRNAVDHGIEAPEVRVAAGKTAHGLIVISAVLRQGRVEISIADDGRGFDVDAIRAQIRKRGLEVPEDEKTLVRMAFSPALSTSETLTEVSGRGVGLDVVKTAVESIRGGYDVSFEAGRGSRIVLSVPLTLTKLPALLVRAGGQTFAFDSAAVYALRRIGLDDLKTIEGRDVLMINGSPVPVFRLLEVLGQEELETKKVTSKIPVVIVQDGAFRVALTVDELLTEKEVVVKDLGPRLQQVNNVSGAIVLSTGHIALILNATDLIQNTIGRKVSGGLLDVMSDKSPEMKTRILVVDDSITTRTLVKNILESSGYEVFDAADGMEAWQFLQDKKVDLVVSDVEMPRMDGFALTEAIRNSRRLEKVPVILVTALETEPDKMRGLDAGANAYLPKSGFDQTNLIEAIEQLV